MDINIIIVIPLLFVERIHILVYQKLSKKDQHDQKL